MKQDIRIGLQIDETDSPYSRYLVRGVSSFCSEKQINLIVFSGKAPGWPYGFGYQGCAIHSHISKKNIDIHIIASGTQENYISREAFISHVETLTRVPLISIATRIQGIPAVMADEMKGFRDLIRHIIEVHKCKRFAVITGPETNQDSICRWETLQKVLEEYDLVSSTIKAGATDYTIQAGKTVTMNLFADGICDRDALVCFSDLIAVGALEYLASAGIRVPEDIVVVGYDNLDRGRFNEPPLSTVSQNVIMQGYTAASLAFDSACGKDIPLETFVETQALLRQSCGCIAADDYSIYARDIRGNEVEPPSGSVVDTGYERFYLEDDLRRLQRYLSRQHAGQTFEEHSANIHESLRAFDIKSCAICLYPDKIHCADQSSFTMPSRARVVVAFDEDTPKGKSVRDILFDPLERMLPVGIFSSRPRTLVVSALYHLEEQLGYIVYEPGRVHEAIYETLCVQLSTMISSALIFSEKEEAGLILNSALKELESSNRVLDYVSRTDDLTGLYNRRGFLSYGEKALEIALSSGKNAVIFFGDLDGLKIINDHYGHDAGDRALQAMAAILKKVFRSHDIIARLAGDEFAIVALDAETSAAIALHERLSNFLTQWNEETAEPFSLSISLGYAPATRECSSLEDLLARADTVQYQEKKKKKGSSSLR
ncbi:MAG TPA: GGDEF domain-containing protein [Treponemataceae bacterium]|nr:GGDEF domain-containing protein [Treponemataceae bacterium]